MKIFVTTSNGYIHLVKGFAYMFNKHWSPDVEVTILGYKNPAFSLPDNFKFISLGDQGKYGNSWTTALIPFFKQLPDEYFILLLEDYYILQTNKYLIDEAEKHMANGVDKISFVSLKAYLGGYEKEKDANFDVMKQGFRHRLAFWPQFVRRDFILKYSVPGHTIQQYETQWTAATNDDAQILASKQDILNWFGIARRGTFVKRELLSRIKEEDWKALRQLEIGTFESGRHI